MCGLCRRDDKRGVGAKAARGSKAAETIRYMTRSGLALVLALVLAIGLLEALLGLLLAPHRSTTHHVLRTPLPPAWPGPAPCLAPSSRPQPCALLELLHADRLGAAVLVHAETGSTRPAHLGQKLVADVLFWGCGPRCGRGILATGNAARVWVQRWSVGLLVHLTALGCTVAELEVGAGLGSKRVVLAPLAGLSDGGVRKVSLYSQGCTVGSSCKDRERYDTGLIGAKGVCDTSRMVQFGMGGGAIQVQEGR